MNGERLLLEPCRNRLWSWSVVCSVERLVSGVMSACVHKVDEMVMLACV